MAVNKVILIGNVGKDPEIKNFDSDRSVATFSLATSESYTNKSGQKVTQTEWHNVQIWGGLAKVVEKYVVKGMQLYIEGKIRTRSYDKDGDKRYITEIIGNNMQMLGRKSENQSSQSSAPEASNIQEPVQSTIPETDDLPF